MKDCLFFDNNFDGVSDDIFDNVVGFFDFPIEDAEDNVVEEDWDAQFKNIEEPAFGVFSVPSSGLCDKNENGKPKLGRSFFASPAGTARPIHGKTIPKQNIAFINKDVNKFQPYSPISVFESSSSSSVESSNFDLPVIPVKRPRSKRQRISSFSLLLSVPFISNASAFQKNERMGASESYLQTQPARKVLNRVKRKQVRKDLLSDRIEKKILSSQESDTSRKCMHCEVTSTPQWREGPMGPKTLCNACGVRYRSGRLFPEYRPAASPTFVPSLHSNSHKKVVEMRTRAVKDTILHPRTFTEII